MCHEWLSIEAYNKTYHHFIEPVQGPHYWAQTQHAQPVPPHKKVKRGRPKKNRMRSVDEHNVIRHRLKRKLSDFTCGRCGQTNHNIRRTENSSSTLKCFECNQPGHLRVDCPIFKKKMEKVKCSGMQDPPLKTSSGGNKNESSEKMNWMSSAQLWSTQKTKSVILN